MPTEMGFELGSNMSRTIFSIFSEILDYRLWVILFLM